jgi:inorganic pyrophosphatase
MSYVTKSIDKPGSPHYRLYFTSAGKVISPLHDIPLWFDEANKIANMVVEIPRGERAKMEMGTGLEMNPIRQDVKKGKLRYVHWPYPCNYGAFPQTWENPTLKDPRTGENGDNDALDVCEISDCVFKSGDVVPVKILGTYAMIDEGETDWKIIAVSMNDPNASRLNEIGDIEKVYPGKLVELLSFLKYYKTPAGSGPNNFAFDGVLQDRTFALTVTHEVHVQWQGLIKGEIPNKTVSCFCTQLSDPRVVAERYRVTEEIADGYIIDAYLKYVRGSL